MKLSIIIVNYKADKYLKNCLESIGKNKSWEVIVIDNSRNNIGYGAGCNLGAKRAKGEYLLFLNPDTKILKNSLELMIEYLEKNKDVGILGPKLFNSEKLDLQVSSVGRINPLTAIFAFSFLNKWFPQNVFSRKYFMSDWNRNSIKEVEVVSGAALMIRKEVFKKIGGFDEKFFLYFEENDLCLRVKKLGLKVIYYPEAQIIHYKEKSVVNNKEVSKKAFFSSRYLFFKKHFSFPAALFTESILRLFEFLNKDGR